MTLDEIKMREQRLATAREKARQAEKAVEAARDEYAEQEARKAGVVYGKTKVMCRGKRFFVVGHDSFWRSRPFYALRKIRKDGTMSQAPCGLSVPLSDLTIISEE